MVKRTCDIKTLHAIYSVLTLYASVRHTHTRAYTLVHCKISSISGQLSFSLWVLYLAITHNDCDIKIMITLFANAALSAHARTCADRYTQTMHKMK